MEDSRFQEVRRVASLMPKPKPYERQTEGLEKGNEKPRRGSRDVLEIKVVSVLASKCLIHLSY
jgi:hypothetical protein